MKKSLESDALPIVLVIYCSIACHKKKSFAAFRERLILNTKIVLLCLRDMA